MSKHCLCIDLTLFPGIYHFVALTELRFLLLYKRPNFPLITASLWALSHRLLRRSLLKTQSPVPTKAQTARTRATSRSGEIQLLYFSSTKVEQEITYA